MEACFICSPNGCLVDADCYHKNNALHMCKSLYFSRHQHCLILSRQSQSRHHPLLSSGFAPALEPLYLVSSSEKKETVIGPYGPAVTVSHHSLSY